MLACMDSTRPKWNDAERELWTETAVRILAARFSALPSGTKLKNTEIAEDSARRGRSIRLTWGITSCWPTVPATVRSGTGCRTSIIWPDGLSATAIMKLRSPLPCNATYVRSRLYEPDRILGLRADEHASVLRWLHGEHYMDSAVLLNHKQRTG